MRRYVVVSVICAGWCLLAQPSSAAEPTGDVDSGPDGAKAHFRRGAAQFAAGDWSGAIAEYEAAYRILPLPEFLFNIARAYETADKPEEAKRYFLDYLQREPEGRGTAEARMHLALTLVKLHKPERKLLPRSRMSTVAVRIRADAELHFRLGTEALAHKAYQTAITEYEKAFQALPLADFAFNLAKVYEESGDTEKAKNLYLEYLANEPEGPGAEAAKARTVEIALAERAQATATAKPVPTWTEHPAQPQAPETKSERRKRKLWLIAPIAAAIAVVVAVGVGVGVYESGRDLYKETNPNYTFTVLVK